MSEIGSAVMDKFMFITGRVDQIFYDENNYRRHTAAYPIWQIKGEDGEYREVDDEDHIKLLEAVYQNNSSL